MFINRYFNIPLIEPPLFDFNHNVKREVDDETNAGTETGSTEVACTEPGKATRIRSQSVQEKKGTRPNE